MNKKTLETLKRTGSPTHRAASERKAGVVDGNTKYKRHPKHKGDSEDKKEVV